MTIDTTEHQRFANRLAEQARVSHERAIKARRKADRAAARAETPRAISWVGCLQHGAQVAEERAAFDARTAQMARENLVAMGNLIAAGLI